MAYPHRFYLHWVNPGNTTFLQEYATLDEVVVSWRLSQKENDFAILNATMKNPLVPILAPGRKRWAWFSFDNGPATTAIPRLFGQVVAVPGNISGSLITYTLIARPAEFVILKKAVANTLRELPWWDKIFIEEQSWEDDDLVLETRSSAWFCDPVSLEVSISHYLIGEAGVTEFLASEHIDDKCDVTLGTPPVHTVEANAEMSWTQQGTGVLDLSEYVRVNWPNENASYSPYITSFTLSAENWLAPGASLKDGWVVSFSQAIPRYDLTIKSRTAGGKTTMIWPQADTITVEDSSSDQYSDEPLGSITLPEFVTEHNHTVQIDDSDECGPPEVTSVSVNTSWSTLMLPLHHTLVTLHAGWEASRPFTETIRIVMKADMQPVITMPDESQVTKLQGLRSVNLSADLDPENYEGPPIGDSRRRSYVTQARGQLSLMYVILLCRSTIIVNSRSVRVKFAPISFEKMMDVTLRHNVLVHNPRIPSGQALGKVIEWESAYDNATLTNSVTIGCCVGRGGSVTRDPGEPEYVEDDYIDESEDWQQYVGAKILVGDESDVTFTPPLYDPQDDGIDLISGLAVEQAIDVPMSVQNGPAQQRAIVRALPLVFLGGSTLTISDNSERMNLLVEAVEVALEDVPTTITLALKSMKAAFKTDYDVPVSPLKLPKMIDLES